MFWARSSGSPLEPNTIRPSWTAVTTAKITAETITPTPVAATSPPTSMAASITSWAASEPDSPASSATSSAALIG